MYSVKLKKTAPALREPMRPGRVVDTSRGQRLMLSSVAEAQLLARTLRDCGLLS